MQTNILTSCGISDMRIAASKEMRRAANAVVYYGAAPTNMRTQPFDELDKTPDAMMWERRTERAPLAEPAVVTKILMKPCGTTRSDV